LNQEKYEDLMTDKKNLPPIIADTKSTDPEVRELIDHLSAPLKKGEAIVVIRWDSLTAEYYLGSFGERSELTVDAISGLLEKVSRDLKVGPPLEEKEEVKKELN